MAVEWTEPRMVFEISLRRITHQWHFEKNAGRQFCKTTGANSISDDVCNDCPPHSPC